MPYAIIIQMQYNPNPPPFRNNDETFKTTYGTSYRDVPTYQVSPVYENVHHKDAGRRPMVGPPPIGPTTDRDLSPYLYTRDMSPIPIKDRKPYQPLKQPSHRDQEYYDNRQGFQRSRFDDATLKRDEYQVRIVSSANLKINGTPFAGGLPIYTTDVS